MSPCISEAEFLRYYTEYYDKIFNYILRNVYQRETAEDLTANTFLKALRSIKQNNPDITNINGWLYKIAANEVLMHYRYRRGKTIVMMDAIPEELIRDTSREESVEDHSRYVALQQALSRLKPEDRILIELYVFEHKSYPEIADILEQKESTLRSRICRITAKLKKMVDE